MSTRLDQVRADLAGVVKRVFPDADEGPEGWRAPRPEGARVAAQAGTFDPKSIFVGADEGKTGITFYVLYPGDYYALGKQAAPLERAGYKVMRGCIRWSRKGEPPMAPIEGLLMALREMDLEGNRQ